MSTDLRRIQTVCLCVLTAVAVGAALAWLRPVMVPFTLAVFFSIALSPVIDLQTRRFRWPRVVSVVTTGLLGLGCLGLLGWLVAASVVDVRQQSSTYALRIQELEDWAWEKLALVGMERPAPVGPARPAGPGGEVEVPPTPVPGPDGEPTAPSTEGPRPKDAGSGLPTKAIGAFLLQTMNALAGVLSQGLLVAIFMLFLLLGGAVGPRTPATWTEIEDRIKGYVGTKVFTSAITGVLVGVVLALLGVDLALVFGLFAFLLNFVPNVGSLVATVLPLPIVLLDPDLSVTAQVLAFVLPGAIQFAVGNLVETKMMGKSLDLHPVTILVALIFWGTLWGIVGALLATPITAVAKILLEKGELTAPVASAMAGRFGDQGT